MLDFWAGIVEFMEHWVIQPVINNIHIIGTETTPARILLIWTEEALKNLSFFALLQNFSLLHIEK